MSVSLSYMANKAASTLRSPAAVDGKIGPKQPYLSDLMAIDPWPLDEETTLRYALKSPRRGFKTALDGELDIREGDSIIIAGIEYIVRAADVREACSELHTEVVLEQVTI